MNENHDVQLLYNETRLDGSANLNGMIVAIFILTKPWERRRGDHWLAKIYNHLCNQYQ
jgi:hypothetical protein